MGLVRRIVVLPLVPILSLVGIPFPAHAAEDASAPPHLLTFDGRPQSQLWRGQATFAVLPLPALPQPANGQISGAALDGDGQPLAGQPVQLRTAARGAVGFLGLPLSGPRPARFVRTTITDAHGQFWFAGLTPGDYFVEAVVGKEVGSSLTVTLTDGVMRRSVTVRFNVTRTPQRRCTSKKKGVLLGAGLGAIAGAAFASYMSQQASFVSPSAIAFAAGGAGGGAVVGLAFCR